VDCVGVGLLELAGSVSLSVASLLEEPAHPASPASDAATRITVAVALAHVSINLPSRFTSPVPGMLARTADRTGSAV
jgi:hypothetical protein